MLGFGSATPFPGTQVAVYALSLGKDRAIAQML